MAREPMKAINSTRGKLLAANLGIADTVWRRLKGVLGKGSLSGDDALLLVPCSGVHTFGLTFPIDLIFLGKENEVIALRNSVPPNRLSPYHLSARSVLELPAGRIAETATGVGDLIAIETG